MKYSSVAYSRAAAMLRRVGLIWFITAAIGQLAFIAFIVAFYGLRTAGGNLESWNEKPLITGHVPGDGAGNMMFAIHVLLAAVITLGGLAQLIPQIRDRYRPFHRWNGRVFIALALIMALGGLWLTWVRGSYLSYVSALSVSLNGVLIIAFAVLTVRDAMRRRIDAHRRWAMRTFMVVNGVWFFRLGVSSWILLNQSPRWMNSTLSGPADIALSLGSYLVPLLGLQLYFVAADSSSGRFKFVAAGIVTLLTGLMAVGAFAAINMMWLPYM